jgi:putative acetyltransferase
MVALPAQQGKSIGSKLVEAGLDACEKTGYPLVVVLGHPEFNPRFSFIPARPPKLIFCYDKKRVASTRSQPF